LVFERRGWHKQQRQLGAGQLSGVAEHKISAWRTILRTHRKASVAAALRAIDAGLRVSGFLVKIPSVLFGLKVFGPDSVFCEVSGAKCSKFVPKCVHSGCTRRFFASGFPIWAFSSELLFAPFFLCLPE